MHTKLTYSKIIRFWWPLCFTWLMMALEPPILDALIARLQDPILNLAAFGVATSVSLLLEAPVLMLLASTTALVRNQQSFIVFRKFALSISIGMSLASALLAFTPLFDFFVRGLLGVPEDTVMLTRQALMILTPTPALVGYRRFCQGILINANQTRNIAGGASMRIVTIGGLGLLIFWGSGLPGSTMAAIALTSAMAVEASIAWWLSRNLQHKLAIGDSEPERVLAPVTLRSIADFYLPLTGTAVLNIAIGPVVTYFLARGPSPLESLAVFPVIQSCLFVFKSLAISYQEVVVSLLSASHENFPKLRRLMHYSTALLFSVLGLVAFSPASNFIFETLFGLSNELEMLAVASLKIVFAIGGLAMIYTWERSLLMVGRSTKTSFHATIVELGALFVSLLIFSRYSEAPGILGAAVGLVLGRLGSVVCMASQARKISRELEG